MLKSWKTSALGLMAIIIAGMVKLNYLSPEMGAVVSGILVGILGLVAKDNDVSGA